MDYWRKQVRRWIRDPTYDTDALARQYMIFIATVGPWIRQASPDKRLELLKRAADGNSEEVSYTLRWLAERERLPSFDAKTLAVAINPAVIVEWYNATAEE